MEKPAFQWSLSGKTRGKRERAAAHEPTHYRAFAAESIVGGRQNQEDAFVTYRAGPRVLMGVADGMGGQAHGEIASQLVAGTARDAFLANAGKEKADWPGVLSASLAQANGLLAQDNRGLPADQQAGTTATLGVADGKKLHVAHVGDSRAWVYRNGELKQLTKDHSEEQKWRDKYPGTEVPKVLRSKLTRGIGLSNATPDVSTHDLRPNDVVLFTTDGVHGHLTERDLLRVLDASRGKPATEIAKRLVDAADARGRERGGKHDNATAVVYVHAPSALRRAAATAVDYAASGARMAGAGLAWAAGLPVRAAQGARRGLARWRDVRLQKREQRRAEREAAERAEQDEAREAPTIQGEREAARPKESEALGEPEEVGAPLSEEEAPVPQGERTRVVPFEPPASSPAEKPPAPSEAAPSAPAVPAPSTAWEEKNSSRLGLAAALALAVGVGSLAWKFGSRVERSWVHDDAVTRVHQTALERARRDREFVKRFPHQLAFGILQRSGELHAKWSPKNVPANERYALDDLRAVQPGSVDAVLKQLKARGVRLSPREFGLVAVGNVPFADLQTHYGLTAKDVIALRGLYYGLPAPARAEVAASLQAVQSRAKAKAWGARGAGALLPLAVLAWAGRNKIKKFFQRRRV